VENNILHETIRVTDIPEVEVVEEEMEAEVAT